jgi:hypothetical protein
MPGPSDYAELEELLNAPVTPDIGMTDDEVEATEFRYSVRGPDDYVVSRPLDYFRGPQLAERWARMKWGDRYKGRLQEAEQWGHYVFVIRRPEAD